MKSFQIDVTVVVPMARDLAVFASGFCAACGFFLGRPIFLFLGAVSIVAFLVFAKVLYAIAERNYFEDAIEELLTPAKGE